MTKIVRKARTYEVMPSEFAQEKLYTIYKFWARNILTVIIPFSLLAYFNLRIVRTLQRAQRRADLFRIGGGEHRVSLGKYLFLNEPKFRLKFDEVKSKCLKRLGWKGMVEK